MLASPKMKIVEELIAVSTKEELVWLSGYLSGLTTTLNEEKRTVNVKPAVNKLTIAYGTETGSAKRLAADFAAKAKKNGINAKLVGLDQYRLNDLAKEEYFLTILSTHGDGEPPAGAKKFYDHIHANGFQAGNLKYGVLALGDSSYPLFCKAGEDVDTQLAKLGGDRFISLKKCDTDYEEDAKTWFEEAIKKLTATSTESVAPVTVAPKKTTGKKKYTGTLLTNINLNDHGSNKQTHHVEIAAEDVDYLPGDALGIIPENPLATVEAIFSVTGADANKVMDYKGEEITLLHLLKKKLSIVYLPERVVKNYASIAEHDIPETKIGLLDLLKIYPLKDTAQFEKVVSILEPIAPRLYSISSSPEAHNGEVHLTIAQESFEVAGEVKYGLCSDFFCRLPVGSSFQFYIHKNTEFRLPEDGKDVIMIGPGTGIAPFRSFLAHRDATGAPGKNWLFFGHQHFTSDFLYQTEIQNWFETGVLTKINTAFSRDGKEKIYVQQRIKEHGKEFFDWIEEGASVYICGAREPMSVDVEKTMVQVVQLHGNKSKAEAVDYLNNLKEEGRYLMDVY